MNKSLEIIAAHEKQEQLTPLPPPTNYGASVRMTGPRLFNAIKKPQQQGVSREH